VVRLDCLQSRLEDMPALHGELPPEPLAALAATAAAAPIAKERARAIASVPKRGRPLTRSATATTVLARNTLKLFARLEEDLRGVEVAVCTVERHDR
jgi:hypothetical protein